MTATLDDYRWLVGDAGRSWLQRVAGGCGSRGAPLRAADSLKLLKQLRKELPAERAHLIVEQQELRARAHEKFFHAERMFFTRVGLEQATDERLAAYKALRRQAAECIADLCCGIGGDLLALAANGTACGVDLDPLAALFAAANAAHRYPSERCEVLLTDAATFPVNGYGAWHCDPDRRAAGPRTTRLEFFAPSLPALDALRLKNPHAAIKLAPATDAPPAWTATAELEWLGSRGECRQQVAWFGRLARHPGQRAATIVERDGPPRTVVGQPAELLPLAPSLGRYLYEPHAAVLAAKLAGVLCAEHGLTSVSPGIAYLTSDKPAADAALDAFEIVDDLPLDRKQLKAYCRQHKVGRLEVKKRGVEIDPARLRKEIIATGDSEATLIISLVAGKTRAIISRRLH